MIITKGLTKKYGNILAVNDLNLHINEGESYGFLGPNGAGKTTTLMMMLGVLKPTSGDVLIEGKRIDNSSFDIKKKIGVVVESPVFYDDMTAWEYLMFFGKLYGVENRAVVVKDLLQRVELLKWKDMAIDSFSTGMKKKLGFIRGLINSPHILILDEPVSGLDPFGIIQIRNLILEEKSKGTTLILSSHILSEVEQTVERVGILSHGKLLIEDTIENIRYHFGSGEKIYITLSERDESVIKALEQLPIVKGIKTSGNHVEIQTDGRRDYREEIGRILFEKQAIILEMRQSSSSLEDAFVTITEKKLSNIANQGLFDKA